jgi:hypothetical protein
MQHPRERYQKHAARKHDTLNISALQAINSPTVQRYTYAEALDAGVGIGVDRATPSTPVNGTVTDIWASVSGGGSGGGAVMVGLIVSAAIIGVAAVAGTLYLRSQLVWAAKRCAVLHAVCWGGGGMRGRMVVTSCQLRW